MTIDKQHEHFLQAFTSIYEAKAQAISIAPGRVNLVGEFTDYNFGFVLPCALQYNTRILFKQRDDKLIRVSSMQYPGEIDEFDLGEKIVPGDLHWGNYIRAVAFVFTREGHSLSGFDMLIDSDVPQGSGLSSSAALEVAVGGIFNHTFELGLGSDKIALLGQAAENDFIDCQCGVMDQMISACGVEGHAMLLDCESLETKAVPIPDDLVIVIVNSNYPRKLVDSEYNQRRIDCEKAAEKMQVASLRAANMAMLQSAKAQMSENEFKRAHHVISENQRVLDTVGALAENNMQKLRNLMTASHQSLRDDFEVTVPATDGLVEICSQALGEKGAVRMTGGGFGGAIVCVCRKADIPLIENAVAEHYYSRFNLKADIYVCKAGNGLIVENLAAD
ncbi:galactokinase [Glaciecola sp. MH2013]|uniref:galactokinase n=1 Tax=Glaciecola sp. MH2013 TaxID=2785524 RepID=UPI00189E0DF9|nr:galactokinase [Glaciecola sp. MH2013]MBF7074212.1 galactokinase [Glaciecola sp. MH2013]